MKARVFLVLLSTFFAFAGYADDSTANAKTSLGKISCSIQIDGDKKSSEEFESDLTEGKRDNNSIFWGGIYFREDVSSICGSFELVSESATDKENEKGLVSLGIMVEENRKNDEGKDEKYTTCRQPLWGWIPLTFRTKSFSYTQSMDKAGKDIDVTFTCTQKR